MSSEQPWPNTPPDLAESQPQYTDPYLGQPYSHQDAPPDSAQAQGYAAGNGYGYAGYGYATGGYASGQAAQTGSGYQDAQAAQSGAGYQGQGAQGYGDAQAYGGYAGYGGYNEYGQYQQYDQYGQPYAEQQYAPPAEKQYAQPYEDQYASPSPSYAESYAESPQPPQSPVDEYAAWAGSDLEAGPQYAAEDLSSSRDRLPSREYDWQAGSSGPETKSPVGSTAPAGPDKPADPEKDRQPKPKRRRRLVAGVGVLIVIAGGAGAYEFFGGSSANTAGASANSPANAGAAAGDGSTSGSGSGKASGSPSPSFTAAASVTIPSSAGGLTQMTNKVGKAGVSAMQKSASGSADLKNAQFAEYEKNGTSTFFGNLTLAQLSKAPDIEQTYKLSGATGTLSALGATSLKEGQTETPSVPGSAMACGQFTTGGNTLSLCIWVDPSEFGLFAGPKSLSDSQAAQYAEAIETASEH